MTIHNIWAVGRNYAEHAKELGNFLPSGLDPSEVATGTPPSSKGEPMIFLKAGSCRVAPNTAFELPSWSNDIHHEVELAVRFDQNLEVSHYTIAIDFTARDIQAQLKKMGHPWTLAKSFKNACPLADFVPLKSIGELTKLELKLTVNGQLKQSGFTGDMIFGIPELTVYLLKRFPVQPGDVLLTGTPAGVGPVRPGDHLEAEIPNKIRSFWDIKKF